MFRCQAFEFVSSQEQKIQNLHTSKLLSRFLMAGRQSSNLSDFSISTQATLISTWVVRSGQGTTTPNPALMTRSIASFCLLIMPIPLPELFQIEMIVMPCFFWNDVNLGISINVNQSFYCIKVCTMQNSFLLHIVQCQWQKWQMVVTSPSTFSQKLNSVSRIDTSCLKGGWCCSFSTSQQPWLGKVSLPWPQPVQSETEISARYKTPLQIFPSGPFQRCLQISKWNCSPSSFGIMYVIHHLLNDVIGRNKRISPCQFLSLVALWNNLGGGGVSGHNYMQKKHSWKSKNELFDDSTYSGPVMS
jgi:hypothetical protein